METAPIPLQKGEDFAESIAAIATPSGNGGVGIIRISGSRLLSLAAHIIKKNSHLETPFTAHLLMQMGMLLIAVLHCISQRPIPTLVKTF